MRALVTGAAGSIGSEIARQMVSRDWEPILLDIDETRLFELQLETGAQAVLCDIRDEPRLTRAISDIHPSVVIHAAAYKHVPFMECEPEEAVLTNVLGTANVLRAACSAGARFVFISTDKAVNPVSVMGMTKAIGERIVKNAGQTAVRFGNVYGSRGSVGPLFEAQKARGGPIEVTHPDMARYFMSIPQAANLVLDACLLGSGTFVLDMGEPVKIADLAKDIADGCEIIYTGLRPGEKLVEELVGDYEHLEPTLVKGVLRVCTS